VYRRVDDTDRKRVSDSPAEKTLRQPGVFTTGDQFLRKIVTDRLIYDRWLAVVLPGVGLKRIPPRNFTIDSGLDLDEPTRISFTVSGRQFEITDRVEYPFALATGWSEFTAAGVPSLQTLAQILNENRRAVAWRNAQWERSPKLTGYLTRPVGPRWEKNSKTEFLEDWRDYRNGKAAGTPILEDGMEYKQIGSTVSPRDAQDLEGRQLTDIEVCSFYHIAPELIGAREGSFANVAAYRRMLYGPSVGPIIVELENAFNAHIVPALAGGDPSVYADLDRQAAIDGSFMEQASIIQTMVGAPVMTRNEGRAKLDLPRIEGENELITPLNVTAGGQASPTDSGSQNEDPEAPDRAPRPSDEKSAPHWFIGGDPT
jgi:HK97 family phage portal protein